MIYLNYKDAGLQQANCSKCCLLRKTTEQISGLNDPAWFQVWLKWGIGCSQIRLHGGKRPDLFRLVQASHDHCNKRWSFSFVRLYLHTDRPTSQLQFFSSNNTFCPPVWRPGSWITLTLPPRDTQSSSIKMAPDIWVGRHPLLQHLHGSIEDPSRSH